MRTFAVVNQKGGCGKTTTAINLAGVFAARGYRTLLVDMDPQGHCAAGLAIPEGRVDLNIGDAMLAPDDAPVDPQRLLWRVSRNLDLAPSTVRLAALEAPRGELAQRDGAEGRLRHVLRRFGPQYDVALIDCSPAIGMLAFNALVAADEVIIPVETGFFSLQGATKQVNAIKAVGKKLGVAPVHRLLATMHDPASVLSQDLLDELRRRFGGRVVPVVIRHDQALKEAASFGQPVIEYSRESTGAHDYMALADWLIENALKRPAGAEPDDPDPAAQPLPAAPAVPTLAVVIPAAPSSALSPASAPAPTPPLSRAADVAQRTRRLQRAVAIAEARLPAATAVPELKPAAVAPLPQTHTPAPAPPPTAAAPVRDLFQPAPRADRAQPLPGAEPNPPRFGVQITPRGILFVQPVSIGHQVAIAGEFNGWQPAMTPMRASHRTGVLEALVHIPPGRYQYRLVVDGRWMPDPFNPTVAPNPFGEPNSIVLVPHVIAGASTAAEAAH